MSRYCPGSDREPREESIDYERPYSQVVARSGACAECGKRTPLAGGRVARHEPAAAPGPERLGEPIRTLDTEFTGLPRYVREGSHVGTWEYTFLTRVYITDTERSRWTGIRIEAYPHTGPTGTRRELT